jgi:hypothetical protein
MNVLYIGIDNPLSVAVTGETDSISLTADYGNVSKINETDYIFKYSECEDVKTVHITVTAYLHDTLVHHEVMAFRLKKIPDPVIITGEKGFRGLASILENFDFDARCPIISFEMVVVKEDGTTFTPPIEGRNIPERVLQSIVPGDTLYFENIRVRCPGDCNTRIMPDMIKKVR